MPTTGPRRSAPRVSAAGAVVAASGLMAAVALLGSEDQLLLPLSEAGLALGAGALALGRSGVAGGSRIAAAAMLLFGTGPLAYRLVPAGLPGTPLVGTALIAVVTCATVATAVQVARVGRVRGVARWALLLVAADAIATAVMSSVPAEGLVVVYLGAHLELVRPVTLTVWGLALLLQDPVVRRRASAWSADWRRTTGVGGGVEP